MPDTDAGLVTWDVTLTVVTPVHIGDGSELVEELGDFTRGAVRPAAGARAGLELRVTDWDALVADLPLESIDGAARTLASMRNLVAAEHGAGRGIAYSVSVIATDERDLPNSFRVKRFARDGFGRMYIPGSSIKGAIRTALIASAMQGRLWANLALGRTPEGRLDGADTPLIASAPAGSRLSGPNRDLLRFLRLSDFYPPKDAQPLLGAVSIRRRADLPPRENSQVASSIPVFVEALRLGTPLTGTLTVDQAGVEAMQRAGFSWGDLRLQGIGGRVRDRSLPLIEWAARAGAEAPGVADAAQKYFLNLGFGGGWRAKTVASAIPDEYIIRQLSSRAAGREVAPVRAASEYPRSVRTLGQRRLHPGWVELRFARRTV